MPPSLLPHPCSGCILIAAAGALGSSCRPCSMARVGQLPGILGRRGEHPKEVADGP